VRQHIIRYADGAIIGKLRAEEPVEANANSSAVERECGPVAKAGINVKNAWRPGAGIIVPEVPEALREVFLDFRSFRELFFHGILEAYIVFVGEKRIEFTDAQAGIGIVAVDAKCHEGIEVIVQKIGVAGV